MAPPPPSNRRENAEPTLYEILSLTPKHLEGQASTAQSKVVKKAYHRALLQNHPDKVHANSDTSSDNNNNNNDKEGGASDDSAPSKSAKNNNNNKDNKNGGGSSPPSPKALYTVDQIQEAYTVLSDTKKRAEYNRKLTLSSSASSSRQKQQHFSHTFTATRSFQTGLEIVDLDDVDFDERKGLYFRACRCGNPRGYRFTESNLEENEDAGVLMVECLDCSLWLKVLFTAAVVSDDDNDQGQGQATQNASAAAAHKKSPTSSSSSSSSSPAAQRGVSGSRDAARRNSSNHTLSRSGSGETKGGWSFKWSLGLSVGVSASASTSASSGRK